MYAGLPVDWVTPPELGNLRNLESLDLEFSGLTGSIPPELGKLRNLKRLRLSGNRLTGSIPPQFGNLQDLEELILYSNRLTGPIPPGLGNLQHLQDNTAMSGRLPLELIGVPIRAFLWDGTDLCAPSDNGFQEWLASIRHHVDGRQCSSG